MVLYGAYIAWTRRASVAMEQSRLAQQLEIVFGEVPTSSHANVSEESRYKLAQKLLENYDPKTDSLSPLLNPQAKPMTVDEIMRWLKKDPQQVNMKEFKQPESNDGTTKKSW